jgi:hypothetical protein
MHMVSTKVFLLEVKHLLARTQHTLGYFIIKKWSQQKS